MDSGFMPSMEYDGCVWQESSTGSMLRHLRRFHADEIPESLREHPREEGCAVRRVDHDLTREWAVIMVIKNLIPVRVADDARDGITRLSQLGGRSVMTQEVGRTIDGIVAESRAAVRAAAEKGCRFAIGYDSWKTKGLCPKHFNAIIVDWCDLEFERHSVVLEVFHMVGRKNAASYKSMLEKALAAAGLTPDHIVCGLSDHEAAPRKGIRDLGLNALGEAEKTSRQGEFFFNGIEFRFDQLHVFVMEPVCKKARSIVKYYHRNGSEYDALVSDAASQNPPVPTCAFAQEGETRFSGTLLSWVSLIKNARAHNLTRGLHPRRSAPEPLDEPSVRELVDICCAMGPLLTATRTLEGDANKGTISLFLPVLHQTRGASCSADPACLALHSFDCQDWAWRYCTGSFAAMQGSGDGTHACTRIHRDFFTTTETSTTGTSTETTAITYVEGPRLGNGACSVGCSRVFSSLAQVKVACRADAACTGLLFSYGCQTWAWFYATRDVRDMVADSPGSNSCTLVFESLLHDLSSGTWTSSETITRTETMTATATSFSTRSASMTLTSESITASTTTTPTTGTTVTSTSRTSLTTASATIVTTTSVSRTSSSSTTTSATSGSSTSSATATTTSYTSVSTATTPTRTSVTATATTSTSSTSASSTTGSSSGTSSATTTSASETASSTATSPTVTSATVTATTSTSATTASDTTPSSTGTASTQTATRTSRTSTTSWSSSTTATATSLSTSSLTWTTTTHATQTGTPFTTSRTSSATRTSSSTLVTASQTSTATLTQTSATRTSETTTKTQTSATQTSQSQTTTSWSLTSTTRTSATETSVTFTLTRTSATRTSTASLTRTSSSETSGSITSSLTGSTQTSSTRTSSTLTSSTRTSSTQISSTQISSTQTSSTLTSTSTASQITLTSATATSSTFWFEPNGDSVEGSLMLTVESAAAFAESKLVKVTLEGLIASVAGVHHTQVTVEVGLETQQRILTGRSLGDAVVALYTILLGAEQNSTSIGSALWSANTTAMTGALQQRLQDDGSGDAFGAVEVAGFTVDGASTTTGAAAWEEEEDQQESLLGPVVVLITGVCLVVCGAATSVRCAHARGRGKGPAPAAARGTPPPCPGEAARGEAAEVLDDARAPPAGRSPAAEMVVEAEAVEAPEAAAEAEDAAAAAAEGAGGGRVPALPRLRPRAAPSLAAASPRASPWAPPRPRAGLVAGLALGAPSPRLPAARGPAARRVPRRAPRPPARGVAGGRALVARLRRRPAVRRGPRRGGRDFGPHPVARPLAPLPEDPEDAFPELDASGGEGAAASAAAGEDGGR
ncbi:unnamed protein product [Prorocentrum cordatum]|uniref:Uncharacterized protein n=1 Tax=Prorocentrum cordatum TaxID=2364126 RepID=A0ABN9T984_9DINO|nr:unnamed protein product [Polarella glacialis]